MRRRNPLNKRQRKKKRKKLIGRLKDMGWKDYNEVFGNIQTIPNNTEVLKEEQT